MWALLLASPVAAQSVLLAQRGDTYQVVRRVVHAQAFFEEDGKLVPADGKRAVLKTVDEYLPVFVDVRQLDAKASGVVLDGAGRINNEFRFHASFSSPFRLDDVFLVLELDTVDMGKTLFYYEVGRLEPDRPQQVSLAVPLAREMGSGHYTLHVFSRGAEVLTSLQPSDYRERQLERMVARRVDGVRDAAPQPFVGPEPAFPASLHHRVKTGRAVIALRVGVHGNVSDPVVKSATAPEFGAAALEAVRWWRFLPRMKDGRAMEASVEMPFQFREEDEAAR